MKINLWVVSNVCTVIKGVDHQERKRLKKLDQLIYFFSKDKKNIEKRILKKRYLIKNNLTQYPNFAFRDVLPSPV